MEIIELSADDIFNCKVIADTYAADPSNPLIIKCDNAQHADHMRRALTLLHPSVIVGFIW